MSRILETTNYDKFEMHSFNRDVKNTESLEKSMRRHGWIDAYPVHVVKNGNGKLRIKAGHHRFQVAKRLGIPIKYVVCDDNITITELEKSTRSWSISDFLNSYVRAGEPEYIAFKEFLDRTGLPLYASISMLSGEWAGSGNHTNSFKNGTYRIKDYSHANTVANVMHCMKKAGAKWGGETTPILAISKVVFTPSIHVEYLQKKIIQYPFPLEKKPNVQLYLSMFEDIYNYKSRVKVPLAFVVNEYSKNRQRTFGKVE